MQITDSHMSWRLQKFGENVVHTKASTHTENSDSVSFLST